MHNNHRPQGDERSAKLTNILQQCTYPDHAYNYVASSAEALLSKYTALDCEMISFTEYNQPCRFLQIQGKVSVNFKGSLCGVRICLMLPRNYPTQPPCLRIVNENPSINEVDSHYASMESKAAPHSYIINSLQTLQYWQPCEAGLINIVDDLKQLLGQKFPFKKRKNPSTYQSHHNAQQHNISPYGNPGINEDAYKTNAYPGSNIGFSQPPGVAYIPPGGMNTNVIPNYNNNFGGNYQGQLNHFGGGMYPNPALNQYQPYGINNNAQNYQSPHHAGFSNPAFQQMYKDGPNTGFGNPTSTKKINPPPNKIFDFDIVDDDYISQQIKGHQSPSVFNNQQGGYNPQPQPPLVKHASNNNAKEKSFVNALQQQAKTFISTTTEHSDTLRKHYPKTFEKNQHLHQLNHIIEGEIATIKTTNQGLQQFIRASQSAPKQIDVKSIVVPADEVSKELLELDSSLKAWSETIDLLDSKFTSGHIPLAQYLRCMRRIEQERFTARWMVAKWLRYAIEN